jgi:signal peptidase II
MGKFIEFKFQRLFLIFTLLTGTVGCDQITKVVARDALSYSRTLSYFDNAIVLMHAENAGAFLSLGADLHHELRYWLLTISVALVLTAAFIHLLRRSQMGKWKTIAYTLFVAGGLGNLIDRIDRGTVTDFINLGVGSWRTGIFNFADMAIVAGVLILFADSFRSANQKSESLLG